MPPRSEALRPLLLLLVSPPLLAIQEAERPADLEREGSLAAAVREEDLREATRRLVAFGPRLGGSKSGAEAAAWIAARLRSLGLEVEVRSDPPVDVHEAIASSLRLLSRDGSAREMKGAVPYGFSPSGSGRATVGLEPVAGVPTALLADRPPPGAKAPDGVAAMLVDGDAVPGTDFVRLRFLRRDAEGLLPPKGAVPILGIPGPEGEALRRALRDGAQPQIEFEVDAELTKGSPQTVVARLPGRDPSRWILFCAHGDADSGGPGANDNASGIAVVLEIARVLAEGRAGGKIPELPVDLRFAIWGKEIHSTRAFLETERAAGRLDGLLGVVNFDQAGYGTGDEALFVEPDDVAPNDRLVRALLGVAGDHAGKAGFPARFTSNRSLGGTDSYVFSDAADSRGRGLAAVTVFTSAFDRPSRVPPTPGFPRRGFEGREIVVDYDRTYHSSGDLPENTTDLEPHNMGWCARIAALGALRLAAESSR